MTEGGMEPEDLRTICESLNDQRGTGGQSRLARLLPVNPRTVRRWLYGARKIHPAIAARIRDLVESESSGAAPGVDHSPTKSRGSGS